MANGLFKLYLLYLKDNYNDHAYTTCWVLTQSSKKNKSLKNLEVFVFCHYLYTDAVGMPAITTAYSRKDIS